MVEENISVEAGKMRGVLCSSFVGVGELLSGGETVTVLPVMSLVMAWPVTIFALLVLDLRATRFMKFLSTAIDVFWRLLDVRGCRLNNVRRRERNSVTFPDSGRFVGEVFCAMVTNCLKSRFKVGKQHSWKMKCAREVD